MVPPAVALANNHKQVIFYQLSLGATLSGIGQERSDDWDFCIETREQPLFEKLQAQAITAVVVPLDDNPNLGMDLLQSVLQSAPHVIRIATSQSLTPLQAARASELAHHCLPEGCTTEDVLNHVNNSLHVAGLINKPVVTEYITSLKSLPVLPDVYEKLDQALDSERASTREIAKIVEQDPMITAKMMQLVNSAYFGLSREISRIQEAVNILGVRMIRDLVLTAHLFESYPQSEQWTSFSFKQIHQRSMAVARAAQHIARAAKADRHVQAQAFLAGLLHDFGIVVLASHNPTEYHRIMAKASMMEQPVYAIEKLELGVTHAEAGAYLLTLWNLPPRVIEAVLFHHFPKSCNTAGFTPLTAVHVADALLPPATSVVGCDMSSRLSTSYIESIGMEKELGSWQIITANYQAQVGFV